MEKGPSDGTDTWPREVPENVDAGDMGEARLGDVSGLVVVAWICGPETTSGICATAVAWSIRGGNDAEVTFGVGEAEDATEPFLGLGPLFDESNASKRGDGVFW